MDARLTQIAESCLAAAETGGMAFPEIVGTLMEAGFESYAVDFRRATTTYYLPDGDSVALAGHRHNTPIAPALDVKAVEEAVRDAQRNAEGYSYLAFCDRVMSAGCAGYMVSFTGRRVVYFGRTAETHVEHFPQQ